MADEDTRSVVSTKSASNLYFPGPHVGLNHKGAGEPTPGTYTLGRGNTMATRETAAQKTTREAAEAAANSAGNGFPEAWGADVEEFYGHNLTDKSDLIGVPMLLIGAEIERNEGKTYDVAYIYALDKNGVEFEFSDTSDTGVRGQVQAILVDQRLDPAPGGGYQKLSPRVVVRQGLRFSDFTIRDEESGKKRDARTYYLSAAGRKPEGSPKKTPENGV